jgi:hypothetical protein
MNCGAVKPEKGLTASRAFQVFLNHVHVPFSDLQIIKFLLQHFYSFFAAFLEESA